VIVRHKEQVIWVIALMPEVECFSRDNVLLIPVSRNVENFIDEVFIKLSGIFIFYQ
jgi:hypothetical protein